MRIIDAHVHVLDNYKPMTPFQDAGSSERLLSHMDECGVEKAVMLPVVADFSPDNNRECADLVRRHPDRFAILADVPMHEPDAAARVLAAGEDLGAVGTSYYPSTPDLAWMLEPDRTPLWDAYETSGLVCNLQVGPPNYAVFLQLARQHPGISFVLNHLGLPGSLDPEDESYGGLMAGAALPNIFIKASAFYASAATPWDFRCPQALGFFSRLLEGFGTDRLLWGTDWPPTSRNLTYRQALEVVRTFAGLDEAALTQVLGGNAARVFGI
jgi:L-fuconolactonase